MASNSVHASPARKLHRRRVEEARKRLPPGTPPPAVPVPEIDPATVPLQPSEGRVIFCLSRLIDEFPDMGIGVEARVEWAEAVADRGGTGPDQAIKLVRDALNVAPVDRPASADHLDRARLRLGATLAGRREYPAAVAEFEAVAARPGTAHRVQATYRAGECRLLAGDPARAAALLAAFRDGPAVPDPDGVGDRALLRLGEALAAGNDWNGSRRAYEAVLARSGDGGRVAAEARYGVGWALQNQGRFEDAARAYEQVTAAGDDLAAKARVGVGRCRLAQGRYVEGVDALLAAADGPGGPEVGAALLEAARALAGAGQWDGAVRLLREVGRDVAKWTENRK